MPIAMNKFVVSPMLLGLPVDLSDEHQLFDYGHDRTQYFSSLYKRPALQPRDHYFLQHFKGWTVRTSGHGLNTQRVHLMDFRTSQRHGTAFVYTLPLSEQEVFVEYTLFTTELLLPEHYDEALKEYIGQVLGVHEYEVVEEESGIIPMTNHRFRRAEGSLVRIGTAGGDTRASTGYTFTHTQRTIDRILANVRSGKPVYPFTDHPAKNYYFDSTILEVLHRGTYPGSLIFEHMFSRLPASLILKFLDSETNFLEDLRIMNSVNKKPFIAGLAKYLI
jgi:lycopene beta-cyclase